MNVVITPTLLAILNALTAMSAILNGAKVHLYANNAALGENTVLGDLTEATFTGYAASIALVWNPAYTQQDGTPTVDAPSVTFASTSPFTTGNTIYGFYVTNGAGSTLLYAQAFAAPQLISAAFQAVVVQPTFTLPKLGQ
jgi:hypothetical protein